MQPAHIVMRVDEHDLSGEVAGGIRIAGREIRLSDLDARLKGGFAASGSIGLDYSAAAPVISADVQATLEPSAAPRPLLGDLSGDARIQARGTLEEEGPRLQGSLSSGSLTYAGLTLKNGSAIAEYTGARLSLTQVEGEVFDGGQLTGEGGLD